jgi:hypothetical protein
MIGFISDSNQNFLPTVTSKYGYLWVIQYFDDRSINDRNKVTQLFKRDKASLNRLRQNTIHVHFFTKS